MTNIQEYLASLNGYKVSDTHFCIGDSIHSEDFYFAKQLFQNSFHVSRIAFWIATEIDKKILIENTNDASLTLVGYELYSVLLLEMVHDLLIKKGCKGINHIYVTADMINTEIPSHLPFKDNYITIVPISSTGATTKKICDKINEKYRGKNQLWGFQILKAYDNNNSDFAGKVDVKPDDHISTLLELNAKWNDPSNCPLCFVCDDEEKKNVNNLKPLINTDISNLIPTQLFPWPEPKGTASLDEFAHNDKSLEISYWGCDFYSADYKDSLLYMQIQINGDRRVYSNGTSMFIEKNKSTIENWLIRLRNEVYQIKEDDFIILLAPNNESNISFVSLVNNVLFKSSATIILHQADTNFVENFRLLNSHYFDEKNIKRYRLFFVDNDLVTGNTFFRVYDDFRYASNYKQSLEGAIFLFNYSSADINRRVVRAAKTLHTFISANYTTLRHNSVNDRIEKEVERYIDLSRKTLFERYRKELYDKAKKIQDPHKVSNVAEKKKRHLRMFKAVHCIHNYLYGLNNQDELDINELIRGCVSKCYDGDNYEAELSIVKVLCQAPFTYYLPVYPKIFSWITDKLIEIQGELSNRLDVYVANASNNGIVVDRKLINKLKFYVRRAVIAGNSYIVCQEFLAMLGRLIDTLSDQPIETNTSPGELSFNDNNGNIHFYLIRQYIELIHKIEYSPQKLADNLISITFETVAGRQFQGMLLAECSTVLNKLYENIEKPIESDIINLKKRYSKESTKKYLFANIENEIEKKINHTFSINAQSNIIKQIPKHIKVFNNTRYDESFRSFIWIKVAIKYLFTESQLPLNIDLDTQTNSIFKYIKRIGNIDKCGGFMLIKDCFNQKQIVYDVDVNGYKALTDIESLSTFDRWLGIENKDDNGSNMTILSLYKDGEKWYDEFGEQYTDESIIKLSCFDNCNRVLITKICSQKRNDIDDGNNRETLGIISLYWNSSDSDDILSLKSYLLLLRDDIAKFIEYHHKNNEFVQLRIVEERRKYISLFGHGQLTMEKLVAGKKDTFRPIVSTMKALQYIVAFQTDDFTTPLNGSDNVKDTITKQFPPTKLEWEGKEKGSESESYTVDDLIKELETIAKEIYKSDVIEYGLHDSEDVEKRHVVSADFEIKRTEKYETLFSPSFNTSVDIIKFIMFELIVNAKKNRFLLVPGYYFNNADDTIKNNLNTFKNELTLFFENNGNNLTFGVKATSTQIKDDIRKIIEGDTQDNHKPVAGVYLINEILKILGEKKIQVKSEPMPEYGGQIYLNTISVCLKSL